MELSIAERNLEVLLNLQPYEKLIIDEQGNMVVDSRYVQSIRRTITRDSKKDILAPFEETFKTLKTPDEDKIASLKKIQETFKVTYPSFVKLHEELIPKLINDCEGRIVLANTGKTLSSMIDQKMFTLDKKQESDCSEFINNPNIPLSISQELSTFLNVPKTAKLTSREVEYALHRYILKHHLYGIKTVLLDLKLAKLCAVNMTETKEMSFYQLKKEVFSKHVQKDK